MPLKLGQSKSHAIRSLNNFMPMFECFTSACVSRLSREPPRSIDAKISPLGGAFSDPGVQTGQTGFGGGSLPPGVTSLQGPTRSLVPPGVTAVSGDAGNGGQMSLSHSVPAGLPPGVMPISGPPSGVTPLTGLPPGITAFPTPAAASALPPGVTASNPSGFYPLQQPMPVGVMSGGGAVMASSHAGPGAGSSGGGFDASSVVGGLSVSEAKMLAERIATMQREHEAALSKIRAETGRSQVRPDGRCCPLVLRLNGRMHARRVCYIIIWHCMKQRRAVRKGALHTIPAIMGAIMMFDIFEHLTLPAQPCSSPAPLALLSRRMPLSSAGRSLSWRVA